MLPLAKRAKTRLLPAFLPPWQGFALCHGKKALLRKSFLQKDPQTNDLHLH